MKWQRARIVRAKGVELIPQFDGLLCWVKLGPPEIPKGLHQRLDGEKWMPTYPFYQTNIEMPLAGGPVMAALAAAAVELLPEFAEEVPIVSFAEWVWGRDSAE